MKLLIDIPEHIYEHAKEMTEDSRDEGEAMRAIANGTPTRCRGVDEAEKERLIKKDIASIENRVRSAFNQGYEMGLREGHLKNLNTCGDAISRQSAIFLASDLKQDLPDDERIADMVMAHNEGILEYQTQLSLLPSVTPQPKMGRWIKTRLDDEPDKICDDCGTYCWKCSICGSDASGWGNYKYCPKCGAKMEAEE